MSECWRNDDERRFEDEREHLIYRFDHPAGAYCYIGLTADYEERIRRHCLEPDGQLYDFLSRYRASPGEAQQHFRVIDRAMGFRQAEERETAHILSALLASCDPGEAVPRNRKTHQIDVESFAKIVTIAERARAAQGIHESSRRADETERHLRQCRAEMTRLKIHYADESERLKLLVDSETASRKRAEGEKQVYQVLCILLVLGVLAALAFRVG